MQLKKVLSSLVVTGMLAAGVGAGTFAWFTDEAKSAGNEFESGTLSMHVGDGNENGQFKLFDGQDLLNAQPGDSLGEDTITITNTGSLNLAKFHKFRISGSQALAKQIIVSKYVVHDYSGNFNMIDDYKDTFLTNFDTDDDDKVSMYELANYQGEFGIGWVELMLAPENNQSLELGFEFDKDATNSVQDKGVTLYMDVKATQVNAEAIEDSLGITSEKAVQVANWLNSQIK